MTNQTNQGIYIPQRQLLLLLASVMITVSAAIIFSAIFVTNLVQGQVASALESESNSPSATQAAFRTTAPITLADSELTYEDPYQGCTVPTEQQTASPVATNASDRSPTTLSHHKYKKEDYKKEYSAPTYNKAGNTTNTYNNDYRTTTNTNTKNIDNSTNYSHSFNQGSYNTVKGNLTQTNNNNNNNSSNDDDDKGHKNHKSSGYDKNDASNSPKPHDKSVTILASTQPTIAAN